MILISHSVSELLSEVHRETKALQWSLGRYGTLCTLAGSDVDIDRPKEEVLALEQGMPAQGP